MIVRIVEPQLDSIACMHTAYTPFTSQVSTKLHFLIIYNLEYNLVFKMLRVRGSSLPILESKSTFKFTFFFF